MKNRLILFTEIFFLVLFFVSQGMAQKAFNIRSITAGVTITRDNWMEVLQQTQKFLEKGRAILETDGFTVEGVRIATNPFPFYSRGLTVSETTNIIQKISDFTREHKIALAIGPAILDDRYDPDKIEKICSILPTTSANASIIIASQEQGIHHQGIRAAAQIIKRLSDIKTMSNFSFAATANIPSETPFFPGAYHNRSYNSFTIGTESAKLVMSVFDKADNFQDAEKKLFSRFESEFQRIEKAGFKIQAETGWIFEGVDTSPAPMREISIGKAIENLIHAPFGSPGTLSACSIITNVLHGIDVKRAGYSGLMLPIMEDVVLAKRAAEGWFGLDELLSYSAVCGTGLDVIPVPGNITVEKIENILTDVASISVKLQKPLSARLIPIKGKKAGDDVVLESEFLAPTKIMQVK